MFVRRRPVRQLLVAALSWLRSRTRRVGVAAFALVLFGLLATGAVGRVRSSPSSSQHTREGSFVSRALARRVHYLIQLPVGYARSGLRYPVVYFLHGLPAGSHSYQSERWVVNALDQTGRRAIVVIPQAASDAKSDPEYHDWGPGDDWETALAVELPTYIDRHYRTIPSRKGRAIVGVSAGGYGATILGLHHLARYAAIESWSGYFRPTDPSGQTTLKLPTQTDDDRASAYVLVAGLRQQIRRRPTFLGFYVGSGDPTFVGDNTRLDRELTRAGVRHTFAVYPGAHSRTVWAAHAVLWLDLAIDHLAVATSG